MRSRMDRYHNLDTVEHNRLDKNKELYEETRNNTKYTNFTDVDNSNTYLLDPTKKSYQTREDYQQFRDLQTSNIKPRVQKELDEFNYLYQDHENRVYDINSVLKAARENRKEIDELETKRKLKNTNYNILASLNKEELDKYRREKTIKNTKDEEEELRGLINTITSKTLAGEISKETSVNLLSDLMATNVLDKVPAEKEAKQINEKNLELSKDILDKDSMKKLDEAKKNINVSKNTTDDIMKDIDKSFYTKSMDLSDKDFFENDDEDETKRKIPVIIKILLVIVLLALVGVCVYFVIKSI